MRTGYITDLPQPDPLNHATEHAFMKNISIFHVAFNKLINPSLYVLRKEDSSLYWVRQCSSLDPPSQPPQSILAHIQTSEIFFFKPIHTIASNCLDCSKISGTALQKSL